MWWFCLWLLLACVHAGVAPNDFLTLDWCGAAEKNGSQALSLGPGNTVTTPSGLCVTFTGGSPAPLTLEPCVSGDKAQEWLFNPAAGTFEGSPAGSCVAWNAQGGGGMEGPGSRVGTWTCTEIGFNSVFAPNVPSPGLIGYNFSSAGSRTFSNLCVTAVPPTPLPSPPPPPIGSQQVIDWQLTEIGCFIHFNMATDLQGFQGCSGCGPAPPPISNWNPSALDTDSWIATGKDMGCVRFIYVAKHSCGFVAWNSSLTNYTYQAGLAPNPIDVVRPFVASAQKANVSYGFYYSVTANQHLNVCGGHPNTPVNPGQVSVTQAEYDAIVYHHLSELWGLFGALGEVWFDGGYPGSQTAELKKLFATLQPNVVAFQGWDLMPSPVRWVGTEYGVAPYPCWSTTAGDIQGAGNPDGAYWYPAETDFTLQSNDQWFYNPKVGVRSPASLRYMYEKSTGSNTALIIDLAPYPNGSLPLNQVAAAHTMGEYIRGCYGKPIISTSSTGKSLLTLLVPTGSPLVDRVVVAEDQTKGQLIRNFTLTGMLTNGSSVLITNGTSVGNKYIAIMPQALPLQAVQLNVTRITPLSPSGAPFIRNFALHGCSDLAEALDEDWAQTWGKE